MDNADGFVPIEAIFYAVFHPTEGTKIVHQVPENSISDLKGNFNEQETMFNFDTVKNYIIPKPTLCNRLIALKIGKYRVMGYPVNIENPDYSRNSFSFNFCFVFSYDSDTTPYESAIRRMGTMFRVLEEQSFLLSRLDKNFTFFKDNRNMSSPSTNVGTPDINNDQISNTPGFFKAMKISLSSIESLITQIYQDLNNYSECCIPLDSSNSVDIKLFPILPPPLNIKAFQVPIITVKMHHLTDVNWDPTMSKILPFINGINSIKRISELADADYLLTKRYIQHLMHYKCIEMLDIFQFSNIYAPTNHIANFLEIDGMAEECQAYIITQERHSSFNELPLITKDYDPSSPMSTSFGNSVSPLSKPSFLNGLKVKPSKDREKINVPSKATLFYLYRSLNQGQTVKDWYIQHRSHLSNIDIRRFITFGVLRNLIYRVHSYPVLNSITRSEEKGSSAELEELVASLQQRQAHHRKSVPVPPRHRNSGSDSSRRLLSSVVNEANLKTAKSKRRISFKYTVDQEERSSSRGTLPRLHSYESYDENPIHDSDDDSLSDRDPTAAENSSHSSPEDTLALLKLLNGHQHFDSINTELQTARTDLLRVLDSLGTFTIINS